MGKDELGFPDISRGAMKGGDRLSPTYYSQRPFSNYQLGIEAVQIHLPSTLARESLLRIFYPSIPVTHVSI